MFLLNGGLITLIALIAVFVWGYKLGKWVYNRKSLKESEKKES